MKRLTYLLLLVQVLLASCTKPDEVQLLFLCTSQNYGNTLPWDFKNDTVAKVSLANFMSLVKEQRAIYGDRCIVLDDGNMHTRGLSNFYWRYLDTVCEPVTYKVQRYIGYDAVAIGHSDLRLEEPFLAMRHDTTACPPTLCANLINKYTGENFFRPWILLERKGIRIAIFALVDENADGWTPQLGHPDAVTCDMLDAMRDKILRLRHDCNPDVIVGLVSSMNEDKAAKLKEQIPGIDMLITLPQGDTQSSSQYVNMIQLTLTYDKETDSYRKHRLTANIDLAQYEIDQKFTQDFDSDIQTMRAKYREEYGKLDDQIVTSYGIYSSHDYYRDIINQAHLWYSGADISLANIAHADAYIEPGKVNISKIIEIFNHENVLVTMRVTGREVKDILESFYAQQYNQMHSANDPLIALGHDKKGHALYNELGQPYLNIPPSRFTSGAGLYYTVDLRCPPGNRVTIHEMKNGKPYHPDAVYTLTTNSYIASGFGNRKYLPYLNWDPYEVHRRITSYDMPSLTYVIYKYFKECPTAYTPNLDKTCDFIPEEWWRVAKTRELNELNPTW